MIFRQRAGAAADFKDIKPSNKQIVNITKTLKSRLKPYSNNKT